MQVMLGGTNSSKDLTIETATGKTASDFTTGSELD